MRINTQCRCGSRIVPNKDKLSVALGSVVAVWLTGLILATPTGWLAIIPAALAGSANASKIIQLKARLWSLSSRAGSYFRCSGCGRDVGVSEFFAD